MSIKSKRDDHAEARRTARSSQRSRRNRKRRSQRGSHRTRQRKARVEMMHSRRDATGRGDRRLPIPKAKLKRPRAQDHRRQKVVRSRLGLQDSPATRAKLSSSRRIQQRKETSSNADHTGHAATATVTKVAIVAMTSAARSKAEAVVTEAANAAARVPLLMLTRPLRLKKRSTEKGNEMEVDELPFNL